VSERLTQARAWLRQDPDPETRDELAGIITRAAGGDSTAIADLDDRFRTRLAFGTAGLRGELGAGSNRMNRVLVTQAAAGFAGYLLQRSATRPTVVIGYDGRRNSRRFALDSAEILAGAGLRAILLPRLLPTPVLAFAVRHLQADAGIMVTASHNPPDDNGYKVYLGGDDAGSQIVAPADGRSPRTSSASRTPVMSGCCRDRMPTSWPGRMSSTRTWRRRPPWHRRPSACRRCAGCTQRCTAWAGRRSRGW